MGRVGGVMVREGWRGLWNSYTRNLIGFDKRVVGYSKNGTLRAAGRRRRKIVYGDVESHRESNDGVELTQCGFILATAGCKKITSN